MVLSLFPVIAAGAAFVPIPSEDLALFQDLGLGLFVYMVGLDAGEAFLLLAWRMGRSATRASGGVSDLLGQPAVLSFAQERSSDSRITSGYATTFAVALIFTILIIPFMVALRRRDQSQGSGRGLTGARRCPRCRRGAPAAR